MYKAAMPTARKPPDFLNGVPELVVLRLLSQKPMYGYELIQAIQVATSRNFAFGEGCIYPVLHRLEADGALNGRRETVQGRSRIVYRVTAKGRGRLEQSAVAWKRSAEVIQAILSEGNRASPAMA